MIPEAAPAARTGKATSTGGPLGRADELWPSIRASGLQAELRTALSGETDVDAGSVARVAALATAALRKSNRTDSVRGALDNLTRERVDGSAPARCEAELTQIGLTFPILFRSLPRLFRAELGRIHDALGRH